jgi:hypothetical protein
MVDEPYANSSLVKDNEMKSSHIQQEMKQFQSTYFTLRELKPELFNQDYAAQYIKVDGEVEKLAPDMDTFAQLHKDLDTIAFTNTHNN